MKKIILIILLLVTNTAYAGCKTSTAGKAAAWTVTASIPLNTVWVWMYFKGEELYCYTQKEKAKEHIFNLSADYVLDKNK